ncbi:MAG: hypothetical protein Ct9H90mP9_4190 [Pseudomonadota bacterium]|nr:MAG: hypothetical protein Ct9H90mP9_4190 [Pseudomonadota bacterium]
MAGMTDQYANRIYSRFFLPNEGSGFDRSNKLILKTILNQNLSDIDFADSLIFCSPKELGESYLPHSQTGFSVTFSRPLPSK